MREQEGGKRTSGRRGLLAWLAVIILSTAATVALDVGGATGEMAVEMMKGAIGGAFVGAVFVLARLLMA